MYANSFCDAGQVPIFRYFEAWVSLLIVPEFMKDKDTLINVRNHNHEKLLTELESLVVSLLLCQPRMTVI